MKHLAANPVPLGLIWLSLHAAINFVLKSEILTQLIVALIEASLLVAMRLLLYMLRIHVLACNLAAH